MKNIALFLLTAITLSLFTACTEQNSSNDILTRYRIPLGNMPRTFDDQLLYLMLALEVYRVHVGVYPTVEQGLDALYHQPNLPDTYGDWNGPYIEGLIVFLDPWGNSLHYFVDNLGKYSLSSLGADGIVSEDDIHAKDRHPVVAREMEKIPSIAPIPIRLATE